MGILLITLAILIIPIGIAAIANGYLRERFGETAAFAALLAGIVLSGCLFMPIFFWLLEATTTTELDADATSPPGIMSDIGLPAEQVSDFCYQTSSRSVSPRADFEMSEEDFFSG